MKIFGIRNKKSGLFMTLNQTHYPSEFGGYNVYELEEGEKGNTTFWITTNIEFAENVLQGKYNADFENRSELPKFIYNAEDFEVVPFNINVHLLHDPYAGESLEESLDEFERKMKEFLGEK